jgi:hypothetical protein
VTAKRSDAEFAFGMPQLDLLQKENLMISAGRFASVFIALVSSATIGCGSSSSGGGVGGSPGSGGVTGSGGLKDAGALSTGGVGAGGVVVGSGGAGAGGVAVGSGGGGGSGVALDAARDVAAPQPDVAADLPAKQDGGSGGAEFDAPASGGAGGGNACANPQTSFGFLGQGDSNPNFQSGVGALGTNVMYIFSSYAAFLGDGGTAGPWDYEIYVQAFDPKTGASKGPSQSLFVAQTPGLSFGHSNDKQEFTIRDVAVAPTGDIVILYHFGSGLGSDGRVGGLFAAFLSADTLKLQHVVLVTDAAIAVSNPIGQGPTRPRVIWSNASQTFVVNYVSGNPNFTTISKYSVGGQIAGGIGAVPTLQSDNSFGTSGTVGESGNLLGLEYEGSQDQSGVVGLTILDESGNLVGTPIVLGNGDKSLAWDGVAGTAQGFVCLYDQIGQKAASVVFVSTSPDAGIVGATDSGVATYPGFTLSGKYFDVRAIADNIGTGGKGGVGVALSLDGGSVSFAYVNADGMGHLGPIPALAQGSGAGAMSLTNFNGSFVLSSYTTTTNSTQIVATGICP